MWDFALGGKKLADWIKLHRSILQSNVFTNPDILKVWIWILCKCNWTKNQAIVGTSVVDLSAGQMVFGRASAARDLNMSESKVYRIIKTLEKLGNISIEPNNKFSLVTVENWGLFQCDIVESEQQTNNKRTTNKQQTNNKRTTNEHTIRINKNIQEIQEIQEIINSRPFSAEPYLQSAFDDWMCYKKERNESYKPTGLKALIKTIKAKSENYGSDVVIDTINKSMTNGWRGLFFDDLDKQKNNSNYSPKQKPETDTERVRRELNEWMEEMQNGTNEDNS